MVFPAACAGCGNSLPEEGRGSARHFPRQAAGAARNAEEDPSFSDLEVPPILCLGCFKSLPRSLPPWCRGCGRSLAGLGAGIDRCAECRARRSSFDQVISPYRYEGVMKRLILALKYQGQLSLSPFLSDLLTEAVLERLGSAEVAGVVPVPLHPVRLRERSFNQAELLAMGLAKRLGIPCLTRLLRRVKPTRPQSELDRKERLTNLRGAFQLTPHPILRKARIFLVDDLFTTGTTANACAQRLKQAEVCRVTVVTVAHG